MQILKKSSWFIEKCFIFALAILTQGWDKARQPAAGIFYAPAKISGSEPPCGVLMHPLPLRCIATGKAEPSLFSALIKFNSVMRYTENQSGSILSPPAIRAVHAAHRPQLIQQLYQMSINQLISDFLIEMDAKNKAYFFILEHGLLDSFKNYCQHQKTK